MSLSKYTDDLSRSEIVFMGPDPTQEAPLRSFERGGPTSLWDEATELEYLSRVREKAAAKACEVLNNAQAEAESLRLKAQEEGYQAGAQAAQAELEEFRAAAGGAVAAVLGSIESQVAAVLDEWRGELVNLVRVAVEAGTGAQMSQDRANILAALFTQAAEQLMTSRHTAVRVNPEDEAVVADIIDSAGGYYRELYQVKADPDLAPGSIVLENSDGKVENTLEQRRHLVDEILSELSIGQKNSAKAEPALQKAAPQDSALPAETELPPADDSVNNQKPAAAAQPEFETILATDPATAFEGNTQPDYVPEAEAAQEAEQIEQSELEVAAAPEAEAADHGQTAAEPELIDAPQENAAEASSAAADIPLLNESLAFSEVKDESDADTDSAELLA